MGWFILERKDTSQIISKKAVQSIYTRVLVKDFEWGVQVKQGITTLLPSGRITPIFKPPWVVVEIYLGSTGDFLVPFTVSPYLSSFKVSVQGAAYARITDPVKLVKNVSNVSNEVINERVRKALEMSLVSVMSRLQIPEIQQGILQQPSGIAAKIMFEMGIITRYITISNVKMPMVVENALHNLAASYPERDRIQNLAFTLGKNSPMVNQQVLQWENRGNISDLLNILLLANVSGQATTLMTPPGSQQQMQQPSRPQPVLQAAIMIPVPADNKVCPICSSAMDGRTGVLQCPHCKATFHEMCAKVYVTNSGRCPICHRALRVG